MLVHDPTGPHIPSMFAAMVCTAVAHGSEWAKARVLVDSGNEHPQLISQTMADRLGLDGPISEAVTQADGAFLQLQDIGNINLVINNKVVTQKCLSAPRRFLTMMSSSGNPGCGPIYHGCGLIKSLERLYSQCTLAVE